MSRPQCTECGAPLVPKRAWGEATSHQRSEWHAAGMRRFQGRGCCSTCYHKAYRIRAALTSTLKPAQIARFWGRVQKTDACWLWTGWVNPGGYGRVTIGGRPRLAHRVAYELTRGSIPDALTLDHLCFVKTCVNPDHLEPVTAEINFARAAVAGRLIGNGEEHRRKTHCPHGHPYDAVNTHVNPRGSRTCRTCSRVSSARSRRRRLGSP